MPATAAAGNMLGQQTSSAGGPSALTASCTVTRPKTALTSSATGRQLLLYANALCVLRGAVAVCCLESQYGSSGLYSSLRYAQTA